MSTPAATPAIEPEEEKESYRRALKLSHLTRFACILVAAFFFAWAMPFMPFGLDAREYTGATATAIMLAIMAVSLSLLSMFYFMRAARRRDALLAWSAVFDEGTGLHNRQYFLDRLDLEIARAHLDKRPFRVFLLQARRQDTSGRFVRMTREELAEFASSIRETLSPNDTLASLRPDELAVLSATVVPAGVQPVEARLHDALQSFIAGSRRGRTWKVRMGSVSFDGHVDDPVRLLDDTRRELLATAPLVVQDERAA